jgi:hypothetical protein
MAAFQGRGAYPYLPPSSTTTYANPNIDTMSSFDIGLGNSFGREAVISDACSHASYQALSLQHGCSIYDALRTNTPDQLDLRGFSAETIDAKADQLTTKTEAWSSHANSSDSYSSQSVDQGSVLE